ncbi:MAG: endolytic transglycosylase MltG, partial [Oscillospiraceae bacterium]|nr:endolytic transglycosylase MltG [Oscillospiraceae bacterium]
MAKANTENDRAERPKLITGFLAGILYFFFVVGVSAAIAALAWQSAKDVLGLMKEDNEATIIITDGMEIAQISKALKDKGIIEHQWLFTLYCRFSKSGEKIIPGEYTVNALLDYRALVHNMRGTPAEREEIRLSIPEGYNLRQIIDLFAENGIADADALWETAQFRNFEYSFLGSIPFERNRLEGFLYPDTYDFFIGESPASVFSKMLSNFNRKFNIEYRDRVKELDMTVSEIITLASLIEKEAANDDERPIIASVIYNRMKNTRETGGLLQIDATVQYILPAPKPRLLYEDLEIDNPYNTYIYEGLPPGPIASPGLESIRAALYPADTGY